MQAGTPGSVRPRSKKVPASGGPRYMSCRHWPRESAWHQADHYLEPPVTEFSMMAYRKAEEIAAAFKNITTTIFIYNNNKIIAFGRVVGDGRYYAQLADIVVDPDYQGQGLGKYLVTTLNNQLVDYHFVNLSAAPGADQFYKSMGWKKQTTSFIWPQGPKQLRQHCEED